MGNRYFANIGKETLYEVPGGHREAGKLILDTENVNLEKKRSN